MKSIEQIHEEAQNIFDKLVKGKIDVKTAEAIHNNIGKQLGMIKVQMEYATLRKEKPDIKFLNKV